MPSDEANWVSHGANQKVFLAQPRSTHNPRIRRVSRLVPWSSGWAPLATAIFESERHGHMLPPLMAVIAVLRASGQSGPTVLTWTPERHSDLGTIMTSARGVQDRSVRWNMLRLSLYCVEPPPRLGYLPGPPQAASWRSRRPR